MTIAAVENIVTRDAPRAPLPPVDTNVTIPAVVRAAAERADNYYKKPSDPPSGTPVAPTAGEPAPTSPPAAAATPASQPAPAPQPPAPQVTDQGNQPVQPAVGDPSSDSYEHKFKSQQGRIASQTRAIQQLQDQLSQMGNELSQATYVIEQLRAGQNQPAPQRLITEEDEQTYGSDFIGVARKAAQEALSPEVASLRDEVQQLRERDQQRSTMTVHQTLDAQVPNWRIVNRHPAFLRWLGLRDPMSGAIRRSLLDNAFRAADAARVAVIFQGFLAENAASRPADPAPQPQPAPGQQAPARQPAVSLETLAAPGRARSAPATPPSADKPVYTAQDISAFYAKIRTGVFNGREAEKNAIEQDIFAAQREGRVK